MPSGRWVRACGIVTLRHQPDTANGTISVYGQWQTEGEVRNLVAQRLGDLTPLLGRLATESRDLR